MMSSGEGFWQRLAEETARRTVSLMVMPEMPGTFEEALRKNVIYAKSDAGQSSVIVYYDEK
eukprot:7458309-Lingulodinium_polyedra.AAC.1